jgi:hypothetical protein
LRPAYQGLAVATRDTAETQRLLNLALDISAATGNDLSKVTAALSRAYLGNNTALSRLGVGISKADLKTKSFYEVTSDLAETFKGSATAAANTFQGSMDKLAVASANVQEIIGTGIIDSLKTLGGNTAVDDLANDMERAALNAADFLRGLSQIGTFKISGETKSLLGLLLTPFQRSLSAGPLGAITRLGASSRINPKPFTTPMTISGQSQQSTKVTQQQAKVAKETLKVSKDQLKLAKAKAIFDIQKIQIEAALKGKISEEEKIRLFLLRAIAEENIDDIEKYTKLLNQVQGKVEQLQDTLTEVYAMDAGNPFISWEMGLDGVTRALIEINDASIELTSTIAQNSLAMGLLGGASFADALRGANYAAQAAEWARKNGMNPTPILPPAGISPTSPTNPTTVVEVVVQGTVISQQELQQAIVDAVNNSGLTGNQLITGTPERQVAI